MQTVQQKLAVVTGASSGIGFELAKLAIADGFDLIIAADETDIHDAAEQLRANGGKVVSLIADLSGAEGVEELCAAIAEAGRPVDVLFANAGRGLGHGFLDQDDAEWLRVIDTNIVATLQLIKKIGRDMRDRGQGRILITGSIAGFMPGPFQAVYNGTKAFINSFSSSICGSRGSCSEIACDHPRVLSGVPHLRRTARSDFSWTTIFAGLPALAFASWLAVW